MMMNGNDDRGRDWDFRLLEWLRIEMKISPSLKPQQPLQRDRNIIYLNPPSSGVRGIMLEYGVGREQAEKWWSMH